MIDPKEYFKVHAWLGYKYGRANKCEMGDCKSKSPRRFEWALITGMECVKDRNNFIMLCPSCHRKYDFTEEIRQNISKAKRGIPAHNRVSVSQFSMDGTFIKKYSSYKEAAHGVDGKIQAFSMLKTGRLKTYKSFKWQF